MDQEQIAQLMLDAQADGNVELLNKLRQTMANRGDMSQFMPLLNPDLATGLGMIGNGRIKSDYRRDMQVGATPDEPQV